MRAGLGCGGGALGVEKRVVGGAHESLEQGQGRPRGGEEKD